MEGKPARVLGPTGNRLVLLHKQRIRFEYDAFRQ
jgi:hypothetical protein